MTNRWWVYQREQFPLGKACLLAAGFGSVAVSHSVVLRLHAATLSASRGEAIASPTHIIGSILISWLVTALFLLQLHVAQAFRQARETQRLSGKLLASTGLLTLKELGLLAIASAVIQLGLTLALIPLLVLLLVLVWAYLGAIAYDFGLPEWLRPRLLLRLIAYQLIWPVMALYGTGCDWFTVGSLPPKGVLWFLLFTGLSSIVLQMGRQIRAPQAEQRGVTTFTAKWGRQKAVMVWLGLVWLNTLTTLLAGMYVRFTLPVALVLLLLLTAAVVVAWRFLARPLPAWSKRFEQVAAVAILLLYPCLGPVALVWQIR